MKKYQIAITPGDPESIGPEVTAKSLLHLGSRLKSVSILIFGSKAPFRSHLRHLKHMDLDFIEPERNRSPGFQSAVSVEAATRFVLAAPRSRAMVTGPISKERIRKSGFPYQGHTDFLAHLTITKNVTMMLSNDHFRVALVTNHCPLAEVPSKISFESVDRTIRHAHAHCVTDLGIAKPSIAVLALNPHAGEAGLLGIEETKVILPALRKISLQLKNTRISGPYPADSFFAVESLRKKPDRHDIIIAQYHDQGLIPVKLSNFSKSMNMTLGLPIIRTSVDHGTAFDIAGKGVADPGSMIFAIKNAMDYLKKRNQK